jgi:hypothetical protein
VDLGKGYLSESGILHYSLLHKVKVMKVFTDWQLTRALSECSGINDVAKLNLWARLEEHRLSALDPILEFGKHRGERVSALCDMDPKYLEWIARTPDMQERHEDVYKVAVQLCRKE